MNNINDFIDLFPMSAVIKVYRNNFGKMNVVYSGNQYKIPKSFMFVNLSSFNISFEDGRLVYKFYI